MLLIRPLASAFPGRLEYLIDGNELWFESSEPDWIPEGRGEAALFAILPKAMQHGRSIVVDADIDPALLDAAQHELQSILMQQDPSLSRVNISAHNLSPLNCGYRIATGMSCGVDSLSTAISYTGIRSPSITDLLFFDVGSHGGSQELFFCRLARAKTAANDFKLPLNSVRSNIVDYLASGFEQHNTLYNAAAAFSICKGIGTYLYASSFSYTDLYVGPCENTAYADPVLLGLLSCSAMRFISALPSLTRVQKTELIAPSSIAKRHLNVCVRPIQGACNCSQCKKCARTLLTLQLLDRLNGFEQVFDLPSFTQIKSRFIAEITKNPGYPFNREILELAAEKGVNLVDPDNSTHGDL